ncbi:MAG: DNA-directed RNA polymerase subunit alpha C-terminal domain-containing protein [Chloroflexota bacterium]
MLHALDPKSVLASLCGGSTLPDHERATHIRRLHLDRRTLRALERARIKTIGELVQLTVERLMRVAGVGAENRWTTLVALYLFYNEREEDSQVPVAPGAADDEDAHASLESDREPHGEEAVFGESGYARRGERYKTIVTRIPWELWKELEAYAKHDDRSVNKIVTGAISAYVK